jgi:hypothetical protein
MPGGLAPPLPPGCPWSGFTPPNVDWCEENLCAWVVNPANAWSNLAYVAVGLWLVREARRAGRADLARFGPTLVLVGLFSGVYHASYTWALQLLDFVGMFLLCFLVLARNASRLGWIEPRRETLALLGGTAGASATLPWMFERGIPIQGTVAACVAAALAQEAWLRRRASAPLPRAYRAGLALLGAAGLCSLLDVTRVWCDPTDPWLQGHALWHVLSALAFVPFFRFYASLPRV